MVKWQPSPILVKEMRSTMRGKRTFVGLTFFLLFLAAISLLVYFVTLQANVGQQSAQAGRGVFIFLSIVEALMLATVAPPLTSSAIASERQKQTFDMLMATPLTPGQVLRGKLLASMNYLFLLMFASLPINSIVFLFGGVTPSTLGWWALLVVAVLLMLGTLGLLMSTLFRNGAMSTALTYLICMFIFVAVPIAVLIGISVSRVGGPRASQCVVTTIAMLHPAGSLTAILMSEDLIPITRLLPATLTLYSALAGLLFLGAEARLAALTAQRWRGRIWVLPLLLIVVLTVGYIIVGPVRDLCELTS